MRPMRHKKYLATIMRSQQGWKERKYLRLLMNQIIESGSK